MNTYKTHPHKTNTPPIQREEELCGNTYCAIKEASEKKIYDAIKAANLPLCNEYLLGQEGAMASPVTRLKLIIAVIRPYWLDGEWTTVERLLLDQPSDKSRPIFLNPVKSDYLFRLYKMMPDRDLMNKELTRLACYPQNSYTPLGTNFFAQQALLREFFGENFQDFRIFFQNRLNEVSPDLQFNMLLEGIHYLYLKQKSNSPVAEKVASNFRESLLSQIAKKAIEIHNKTNNQNAPRPYGSYLRKIIECSCRTQNPLLLHQFLEKIKASSPNFSEIPMEYSYTQLPSRLCYIQLLYQEMLETPTPELEKSYVDILQQHADLKQVPTGFLLQYVHFCIRRKEPEVALAKIEEYLQAFAAGTRKPEKRLLLHLTKLKIELLLNPEQEVAAEAILSRELEKNPRNGDFLLCKARLHLNPLSTFFQLNAAEDALTKAEIYKVHLAGIHWEQLRLAYICNTPVDPLIRKISFLWASISGEAPYSSSPNLEIFEKSVLDNLCATIQDPCNHFKKYYQRAMNPIQIQNPLTCLDKETKHHLYQSLQNWRGIGPNNLKNTLPLLDPNDKFACIFGLSYN